jgi:methyl acetate hydrolase
VNPLPGRSPGGLAWAGISNTYFWIDPTKGVAGLLLTQLLPFVDPTVLGIFEHFEQAIYAADLAV